MIKKILNKILYTKEESILDETGFPSGVAFCTSRYLWLTRLLRKLGIL